MAAGRRPFPVAGGAARSRALGTHHHHACLELRRLLGAALLVTDRKHGHIGPRLELHRWGQPHNSDPSPRLTPALAPTLTKVSVECYGCRAATLPCGWRRCSVSGESRQVQAPDLAPTEGKKSAAIAICLRWRSEERRRHILLICLRWRSEERICLRWRS